MKKEKIIEELEYNTIWTISHKKEGRPARIIDCDLSSMDLSKYILHSGYFKSCNFRYSNFNNANMSRANLTNCDFYRSNLSFADLSFSKLTNANLCKSNLTNSNMFGAYMNNCNLDDAILQDCIGNNREIKTIISFYPYTVNYTNDVVWCGCTKNTVKDWVRKRHKDLIRIDEKSVEYFENYKDIIVKIIETSPAKANKNHGR